MPAAALTPEERAKLDAFNKHTTGDDGSAKPPIPGLEFLGIGYDIFDQYASATSCKQPVLDFSAQLMVDQQVIDASIPLDQMEHAFNQIPTELKLIYQRPATVTYLSRFEIRSESEFDSTIDDQITKWSTHSSVGGTYGLFSGEVDARFSSRKAKHHRELRRQGGEHKCFQ